MEYIYFTMVAVVLYACATWVLERIEVSLGRRLQSRSLVFFFILLVLAVTSFSLIRQFSSG